jgi:hypothetical protein
MRAERAIPRGIGYRNWCTPRASPDRRKGDGALDVNLYLDSPFRIERFGKNYGEVIAIVRKVARTHEGVGQGDSEDKTSG